MILGTYSATPSSVQKDKFERICALVQWDNAHLLELKHKGLHLVAMRDARLPKKPEIPWYVDEQKDLITFVHGTIYNPEILEATNETLTQRIAELAETGNLSFIEKLNGDFSIGIFNLAKDEHFLVKDHLGIVPLSFAVDDNVLYFSSDTMAMTKALFDKEPINHSYIVSTFYHFEENFDFTPHEKVVKIRPGNYIKFKHLTASSIAYWIPQNHDFAEKSYVQRMNALKKLLVDAIQVRCDSNYTAGAHISGGLDSCLVAAVSRSFYPRQSTFHGYTWSPDKAIDPEKLRFDERKLILLQCEKSNIVPAYSNFTRENYDDHLSDWRAPSESVFEKNILALAQQSGVNLIFSGWGGDEFISMGSPYLEYDLFWSGQWRKYLQLHPLKRKKALIRSLLSSVFFPKRTIPFLIYKMAPFLYKYMERGLPSNKINPVKRSYYTKRKGVHLGFIAYKHLTQRCEDWYIQGQRSGVEYRYPLLDKRIIEFVISLPTSYFVKNGLDRNLIRTVGEDYLVPELLKLPSKGEPAFGYVYSEILQEANKDYMNEIDAFRKNEYLRFFDFDRLEKDFRESMDTEGKVSRELLLVIPYVKQIHEFTQAYHNQK